jgi:uncharacterized protein YndB with AHSA1/START domain
VGSRTHRTAHAVEIERPAGDIFPYLVAGEKRRRWMSALVEAEQVSEGPIAAGSRFRDVFEDHGQRVELDAEIVRHEPPRLLVVALASDVLRATSTSALDEADGRTRLSVTIDTEYTRTRVRLLAGVINRHAQARLEGDLAALKALMERS